MKIKRNPRSETTYWKILAGRILEDAVFKAIIILGKSPKYKDNIIYLENEREGKKSMTDCFFITKNPSLIFLIECKNWGPIEWKQRSEKARISTFKSHLKNGLIKKWNFAVYKDIFDINENDFKEDFLISKDNFFNNGEIIKDKFVPLLIHTGDPDVKIPFIRDSNGKNLTLDPNKMITSATQDVTRELHKEKNRFIFDKFKISTFLLDYKKICNEDLLSATYDIRNWIDEILDIVFKIETSL